MNTSRGLMTRNFMPTHPKRLLYSKFKPTDKNFLFFFVLNLHGIAHDFTIIDYWHLCVIIYWYMSWSTRAREFLLWKIWLNALWIIVIFQGYESLSCQNQKSIDFVLLFCMLITYNFLDFSKIINDKKRFYVFYQFYLLNAARRTKYIAKYTALLNMVQS